MRPRMELIASISLSPGIVLRAAKARGARSIIRRSSHVSPIPTARLDDRRRRKSLARRWRRRTGRRLSRRRRAASLQRLRSGLDDAHYAALGAYLGRPTGEAPHGAIYFNVTQFLVDRSWYMRWLTARPNIKPVYFVHDLIPFEAPEFLRAREAMLHSKRMSKIRRYGAGAVVGSQAVARRLRASTEETPPTPMPFLQRLTTSSRNYKAPSTRTRIDPAARRAHYFFTPNESPSARTTWEVRGFI